MRPSRRKVVLLVAALLMGCGYEATAPVHRVAFNRQAPPPDDTTFIPPSGNPPPVNPPCTLADSIPVGNGQYAVFSWHYPVCPKP